MADRLRRRGSHRDHPRRAGVPDNRHRQRADLPPVRGEGGDRAERVPLATTAGDGRYPCFAAAAAPRPLSIHDPLDRIGRTYAEVDPAKVVGVVHTNEPDGGRAFAAPDEASRRIAEHVAEFFVQEMRSGRIPPEFLPLQSGVGNICNAVLSGLASHKEIPRFKVYTEVLQDAMFDLIASVEAIGASSTALTLTDKKLKFLYENFGDFTDRIVLRPQEISNNPGIARQPGRDRHKHCDRGRLVWPRQLDPYPRHADR